MPTKRGTTPWRPYVIPWEGARFSDDGTRLRLVYITGNHVPVDTANVRREPKRLLVTLSRMDLDGRHGRLAAFYHCVELTLAAPAGQLILIDGATGERATAKESRYLDPQHLRGTERTLDEVFTPSEFLVAKEFDS